MENKEYIITEGSGNTHYGIDFYNAIHNKSELTLRTFRQVDSSDWLGMTWTFERKEAGASDDTYETLHQSGGPIGTVNHLGDHYLIETFSTAWTG